MKFKKLRYLNLLVVIVIMMILSPFVSRSPYLRMTNNIVLILVLLSVVNTVKKQRWAFMIGLMLGIPWVLAAWIHLIHPAAIHPAILAAAPRCRVLCDGSLHPVTLGGDPPSLEALLDEEIKHGVRTSPRKTEIKGRRTGRVCVTFDTQIEIRHQEENT